MTDVPNADNLLNAFAAMLYVPSINYNYSHAYAYMICYLQLLNIVRKKWSNISGTESSYMNRSVSNFSKILYKC